MVLNNQYTVILYGGYGLRTSALNRCKDNQSICNRGVAGSVHSQDFFSAGNRKTFLNLNRRNNVFNPFSI